MSFELRGLTALAAALMFAVLGISDSNSALIAVSVPTFLIASTNFKLAEKGRL